MSTQSINSAGVQARVRDLLDGADQPPEGASEPRAPKASPHEVAAHLRAHLIARELDPDAVTELSNAEATTGDWYIRSKPDGRPELVRSRDGREASAETVARELLSQAHMQGRRVDLAKLPDDELRFLASRVDEARRAEQRDVDAKLEERRAATRSAGAPLELPPPPAPPPLHEWSGEDLLRAAAARSTSERESARALVRKSPSHTHRAESDGTFATMTDDDLIRAAHDRRFIR